MLDLTLLVTQLLCILVAARALGWLFRLVGQPRVIGEMVAGITLGPSVLGALAPDVLRAVFPPDRLLPLAALSHVGVILFMFVVGLRLDTAALKGRLSSAVAVSHASIALPFLLGAGLGVYVHDSLAPAGVARLPFVLFLGAAMSVTAFPVLARILAERGLLQTRIGTVALACAAVDDVTAWCLLAAVVSVARVGSASLSVAAMLAATAAYVAVIVVAVPFVLRWWMARPVRTRPAAAGANVLGLTVLAALASALVTERLGVHALFGAFLMGAVMPRADGFARGIADRLEEPVGALSLPVFFAFTGLRTEIGLLQSLDLWGAFSAILLVAVAGKLVGSAAVARLTALTWPEAISIGVLMNTRGLMELVILNIGLEIGVISPPLFAMMVLMAVATTVMAAPVLDAVLRLEAPLTPDDERPRGALGDCPVPASET